ncbi:MAG: hypothetical protein IRZ16_01725 [Myxococcaceae bacterium]|nr:hypothetical protein [Myxococcaceae bacterium]
MFRERSPEGDGWHEVTTIRSGRLAPVAFPDASIDPTDRFNDTGALR